MDSIDRFLHEKKIDAYLMISESQNNASMYYLTGFLAPDSFIYLKKNEEGILFISQMEYGRAKKESTVKRIESTLDHGIMEKVRGNKDPNLAFCDFISDLMGEYEIKSVAVPMDFPIYVGDCLRKNGIKVVPQSNLIENDRSIKTPSEVDLIKKAQFACEKAMKAAINVIKNSNNKKGALFYKGESLTSEKVKQAIKHTLIDWGCTDEDPIVACGKQASDPHFSGSGQLMANQPVIIDIFPRLQRGRYFSDMSRTVSFGKPSTEVMDMYVAVLDAQNRAIEMVKPGVKCSDIHNAVCDLFEERGYGTTRKNDRSGFIHATGHGVGLEIHEKPTISENDYVLLTGNVITIEPGLYDPKLGGVRIEDILLVKNKKCENLTKFKKDIVVDMAMK